MSSPHAHETSPSFADLGLPERLVSALTQRGITRPTPIQARALPDALAGRDLLGRAQTGSGKTLAFGLPLLTRFAGDRRGNAPRACRALVVVPTRELAEQVKEAIAPLAHGLGLRVTAVYGGASMQRQVLALQRGVDVLVATPGRLEDHIRQGTCTLGQVEVTVLDEADYMTDLGFLPAVTRLLDQVPAGTQRLLFSATLDREVDGLVRRYLVDPVRHAVAPEVSHIETMEHRAFTVKAEDKVAVIAEIAARPGRTLLFVRTKHGADRLARQLCKNGVAAGAIHGDLRQSQRRRALESFTAGHARVLVATDVAARGIHVDGIDLVVHFDPPSDPKGYLHRSGRTARAGSSGVVLSLLLPHEVRGSARLHKRLRTGVVPTSVAPGHQAVRDLATSGTPIVIRSPATAGHGPSRPQRQRPRRQGRKRPPYKGRRAA
ncbi:MAG: DEAD/DEAH box helicase [Carbonactinosporaceae bacterium]